MKSLMKIIGLWYIFNWLFGSNGASANQTSFSSNTGFDSDYDDDDGYYNGSSSNNNSWSMFNHDNNCNSSSDYFSTNSCWGDDD